MGDISIVDDKRDICELISDILKDEGFTTRLAGTSDQCMVELNKEPPGLMILDIWLKDSAIDGSISSNTSSATTLKSRWGSSLGMAISKSPSRPSIRGPMTSLKSPSTLIS